MTDYILVGVVFGGALLALLWYINSLGGAVRSNLRAGWEKVAASLDCAFYPGFFLAMPYIKGTYRVYPVHVKAILLGYFGSEAHTSVTISLKEKRSFTLMAAGSDKVARPSKMEDVGYNLKNFGGMLYAQGIPDAALSKVVPEDTLRALLPGEQDSLWIQGADITVRRDSLVTDADALLALVRQVADYAKLVERQP